MSKTEKQGWVRLPPACCGAQSESRGWCTSTPDPHSPPLNTPPTRLPEGRRPYISWGLGVGGWGGLPLRAMTCPILGLAVCHQQPFRQVFHKIWAPEALPLSLLDGGSHSQHPPRVIFLQVYTIHPIYLTDHYRHLIDVGEDSHIVKDAHHHVQCRLEAGLLR